ncbi:hypothetical protein TNCV_4370051 [Trichonephila clavipes]|nr:hypothetical protein TNCV_4370051 [Trichonephila clavipes]
MERYTNIELADMHLAWHTRPLSAMDDPQNGVVSLTSPKAANFQPHLLCTVAPEIVRYRIFHCRHTAVREESKDAKQRGDYPGSGTKQSWYQYAGYHWLWWFFSIRLSGGFCILITCTPIPRQAYLLSL